MHQYEAGVAAYHCLKCFLVAEVVFHVHQRVAIEELQQVALLGVADDGKADVAFHSQLLHLGNGLDASLVDIVDMVNGAEQHRTVDGTDKVEGEVLVVGVIDRERHDAVVLRVAYLVGTDGAGADPFPLAAPVGVGSIAFHKFFRIHCLELACLKVLVSHLVGGLQALLEVGYHLVANLPRTEVKHRLIVDVV